MKDIRSFMIRWNNENPLDKKFREKYKIPFNSPQHREINQLDILAEFIEDEIFNEFEAKIYRDIEKEENYSKGQWLREQDSPEEVNQNLFDKIDISSFNKNDSQIQVK